MKKLLALLLASVMCLSLIACGGGETPNTDDNSSTQQGEQLGGESTEQKEQLGDESTENNTTENTESPYANHPLLQSIIGEWELQDEEIGENPYSSVIINEDGTCIVDGQNAIWTPTDRTNETRIHLAFYIDGECIGGAQFSQSSFRATSPLGRPCAGILWEHK